MEFLALAAILFVLGTGLAIASGDPYAWIREELERIAADVWPTDAPSSAVLTLDDPRCRRTNVRMRWQQRALRRRKITPRVAISSAWQHDERAFRFVRAFR